MGKLRIFVKADGITTSSLTAPGVRRKMIKPVPKGKWWGQHTMYVNPCEFHDELTPTVPVDTRRFKSYVEGGEEMGIRRYCVMCWTWVDNPELLKKDGETIEIDDKIPPEDPS